MADDTTINPGSGGDVISSDHVSTLNGAAITPAATTPKVQRVKVAFGDDNTSRDVSATYPLPVVTGDVRASTLLATATGAAVAATATLPAPGAGLFHYITAIRVERYMTAVGTVSATRKEAASTNLNGVAFTLPNDSAGQGVSSVPVDFSPVTPMRSAVANTASTISTPAITATTYLINVFYFTAP